MASKAVAFLTLLSAAFAINLGNFWFTYGLWPKSWGAFTLFWVLSLINYLLLNRVSKEVKES